jgi:aspartate-semialdehyde dehydrogenase
MTGMFRVAIVGAATLKGKEVADVLNERRFPAQDVKLLDDDESLGQLEAVGDEVSFVQSVLPEHFEKLDFTFFASDEKFTRRNWQLAREAGSAILDLSYALEDEPEANVRAPWIERELGEQVRPELQPAPVITAHPAAVVLALLTLRAQRAGEVRRAVATILEPASERGKRGMDELHEQTVNLLSFRDLPREIFDTQVAFNVVGRYGEGSETSLERVQNRIASHFQRITARRVPVPAVMLLQVPSFHGHGFSIYVEMANNTSVGDFAKALTGEHVTMTRLANEAPSNVNAAGQDNVVVSVRRDAVAQNGFWIWAAADNLRLTALTAVECAETMAATRPKGKVQ